MEDLSDLDDAQKYRYNKLNKNCPHKPCFVAVYFGACYLLEAEHKPIKTPTPLVRGKGITWKA